jgi:hypothetical protein
MFTDYLPHARIVLCFWGSNGEQTQTRFILTKGLKKGIVNTLPNQILIIKAIGVRIENWDYLKLKSYAQQREQLPESRNNLQNVRKSLPAIYQIKD